MSNDFIIEDAFKELTSIIEQLNDPKVDLKTSLELYKKGVELSSKCDENLKGVEKELEVLNAD